MKRNLLLYFIFLYLLILFSSIATAQKANRIVYEQCGTMQHLQEKFKRDPALKVKFENQRTDFNRAVENGTFKLSGGANRGNNAQTIYTIPVVFHIVTKNPNTITDKQVLAQLDTLNKDFAGLNGDSVKIPAWFKSVFGKSFIKFCLAQQTPGGESTTGIERITTTRASFTPDDAVKHKSLAGANVWNSDKYFNVWICALSGSLLGYSTFPGDNSPDEQGVVIDFRSLPDGSLANYNSGKTLTHETGHYFNLYHTWGDDDGACSGTDYVDDTPNQSNSSSVCYSGIKTDNCTTSGDGIMYQDYMDYTPDDCLVMFTLDQVQRMETAFALYRSSLLSSNGCQPPLVKNYDARIVSIDQPSQRLCTDTLVPVITIKNNGVQTLSSLNINARIDNGSASVYAWTGSLARSALTKVNLNNLITTPGIHTLTVYVSNPDGNADEDNTSDTLSLNYQYSAPLTTVSEGFERTTFPPAGWDIVNPDGSVTWKRVTNFADAGNASVVINNFADKTLGEKDDLRLPVIKLDGIDSAFLTFNVAAAAYTALNSPGNNWDTLEVLASTDCGQTYASLYKKYGNSLVTRAADTNAFAGIKR